MWLTNGDQVAAWLTKYLDTECRLVRMHEDHVRKVSADYRAHPDDQVDFADGFRFLVATEASLAELNSRIGDRGAQVPMTRFRPNIVIAGDQPAFDEDSWHRIRIGELELDVVHHCTRCKITTVDQQAGEVAGTEPLATLATFRRTETGKVAFGVYLSHLSEGTIKVGDTLEVLERRPAPRQYGA